MLEQTERAHEHQRVDVDLERQAQVELEHAVGAQQVPVDATGNTRPRRREPSSLPPVTETYRSGALRRPRTARCAPVRYLPRAPWGRVPF
jgi:hypothetical protein